MPAPCQICATPDPEPYLTHDGMDLVRCRTCGLIYLDPMPTPETVASLYDDAYQGATAGYFGKVEKKLKRCRGRVRQMAKFVRAGRFLDVGANGGFMAEAAREAGFEAFGVEPDPVSVAFAREHYPGCRFFSGTLEDADLGGPTFDAVYCSEVIEHVPDVNRFVGGIANAMAPGGVLFLTTPDISHWRRPKDVTQWDGFCPPSHCLYFSPANLTRLLAGHGLEVIARRPAFKPGIKLFARKG